MKQTLLLITFLFILALTISPIARAVTPSPSAKPSATPKSSPSPSPTASASPSASPQTAEDTAQKLKELIQKGKERVKGVMDQVGDEPRGFIGEVQRVTDKTVTVKGFKGTEILNVSPTAVLTKDGKKATIDDIAIGDWVAALGSTNKEVFTLKKLLISSTTLAPANFVTQLATIKTITKTQITATPRNNQGTVTYIVNSKTLFQDNIGNKVDVKTIKPDYQYLFVGIQDDDGITLTTVRTLGN